MPHLYVHVPFCARRCAYCDFAIAVRSRVPVDEYVTAVRGELATRFGAATPANWQLDTLYFGGGTPSRLGGAGVSQLIAAVGERASLATGAEVTLETNPEDVTADAVLQWSDAGVNRVSLGSQSFDDKVLAWMHRVHDAAAIPRAVQTLREGGISNISLDLIFALPAELDRDWRADLEQALALEPEHLSLYGLTVEPGTPLGRWRDRGIAHEATDDRYADEFLLAHDMATSAGFEHYEVSNFGKPGRASRHNQAYWSGVDYAGVGPGAHELAGDRRRWNTGVYREWARLASNGEDPMEGDELLGESERALERVYLGLRSSRGLTLADAELHRVSRWVEAGWATVDNGRAVLTPTGWLRLDALAADLSLIASHS